MKMDNTQHVLITAEIDQIIEASYRAIMFEPIDKYTIMTYRSMLSVAISKMKNDGVLKAYSIDIQITPGNPDKIEGRVMFTPTNVVKEIVMNFNIGTEGLGIFTDEYKFDQAMKGI